MAKVRAADQIGTSGLAMVSVIAMQEDACGYKRAVSFWNEPLMLDLGMRARNTFNRTREACIEAGWLKYKSGGTRKVGYYYVSIPDEFLDEKDSAVDERLSSNFERNEELMRDQCETNKGLIRDQCGSNEELMRDQCDTVSTLSPIPNPTPKPNKSMAPKVAVDYSEDFETFWKLGIDCHRKNENKQKVFEKYRARRNSGIKVEDLLFVAERIFLNNQRVDSIEFRTGLFASLGSDMAVKQILAGERFGDDALGIKKSKSLSNAEMTMQSTKNLMDKINNGESFF